MSCLKCGNETPEGENFCQKCLEDMKRYPVPEDTYVMIPRRSESERRSVRKQTLSDAEKLTVLRRRLKRTRIFGIIMTVLVVLLCGVSVFLFVREQKPALGQNYSTVTSTTSTTGSMPTEG